MAGAFLIIMAITLVSRSNVKAAAGARVAQ
jgi:hypothetical protein